MRIIVLIGLVVAMMGCKESSDKQEDQNYHKDPLINELTVLLKQNPKDAGLWVSRAQAFYERQGYDEAIQDMAAAMRLDSLNPEYHHFLADIYMDYYKSRLALSTMQRAAVLHPTRIPTLLKLSNLQTTLTFYEESLETLDKIMRVDPQNADALLMFGLNYAALGDTARSIGAYQRAVQIDPELTDAWIRLAQLRAARKEPNALQFFDAAIKVDSENELPYMAKADFLWSKGMMKEAVEVYKQVILLNPSYADAYYNIGLVYMEQDSLDRAYENFDLTIKMNPLYFKAFFYRGLAQEGKGNLDQALKDYQQCMKMAPGYDKAKENYNRLKEELQG